MSYILTLQSYLFTVADQSRTLQVPEYPEFHLVSRQYWPSTRNLCKEVPRPWTSHLPEWRVCSSPWRLWQVPITPGLHSRWGLYPFWIFLCVGYFVMAPLNFTYSALSATFFFNNSSFYIIWPVLLEKFAHVLKFFYFYIKKFNLKKTIRIFWK